MIDKTLFYFGVGQTITWLILGSLLITSSSNTLFEFPATVLATVALLDGLFIMIASAHD